MTHVRDDLGSKVSIRGQSGEGLESLPLEHEAVGGQGGRYGRHAASVADHGEGTKRIHGDAFVGVASCDGHLDARGVFERAKALAASARQRDRRSDGGLEDLLKRALQRMAARCGHQSKRGRRRSAGPNGRFTSSGVEREHPVQLEPSPSRYLDRRANRTIGSFLGVASSTDEPRRRPRALAIRPAPRQRAPGR